MSNDENALQSLTGEQISTQLTADIEEQEQAIAVLGAAEEDKCTYRQGYLPRQALFSCLTCRENNIHPLLCYACSIHCHDGHSVIELFTKRNKRCDCPTHSCKIEGLVIDVNSKNKYTHNSQKGHYCACERSFPDENDPIADSMYQCVVCEDWYHTRHLFTTQHVQIVSENESSDPSITKKVEFRDSKVLKMLDAATTEIVCVGCRNKYPNLKDDEHICKTVKRNGDDDKPDSGTDQKLHDTCLVFDNSRRIEWAQCEDCEDTLHKQKITFLTDIEDSIYHFENVQKKQVDSEMNAYLNANFDHSAQLTIASGMQDLKQGLSEFLSERKRAGDTLITEESVREFFGKFKKSRIEN